LLLLFVCIIDSLRQIRETGGKANNVQKIRRKSNLQIAGRPESKVQIENYINKIFKKLFSKKKIGKQ